MEKSQIAPVLLFRLYFLVGRIIGFQWAVNSVSGLPLDILESTKHHSKATGSLYPTQWSQGVCKVVGVQDLYARVVVAVERRHHLQTGEGRKDSELQNRNVRQI